MDRSSASTAFADLEGDGDADLVIGRTITPDVVWRNAGGVFSLTQSLADGPTSDLALGDVDGDGAGDLIVGVPEDDTAGLDAGQGYATWPKMDGQWIPSGLWIMAPGWKNIFENAMAVQFNHRVLAYVLLLASIIHVWRSFTLPAMFLAYAVFAQACLGILTLLLHVPLAAALVRVFEDDEHARDLARRGLERARAFSWKRSATILRAVYAEAVTQRRAEPRT